METIIAASITALVTLVVCIITNHAQQEKTRALMEYQIGELRKTVDKHNQIIERTFKLEGKMQEVQHDIQDLKAYHKPN